MLPLLLVVGGGVMFLAARNAGTVAKLVTGFLRGQPVQVKLAPIGNGQSLREDAARAFLAMQAAAKAAGFTLPAVSGFRTNEQQQSLYAKYIAGTGNMAAQPGYSNHQAGLSVDIGNVGSYTTPAYKWLKANAAKYGFIDDVQGEHWHWTFRVKT